MNRYCSEDIAPELNAEVLDHKKGQTHAFKLDRNHRIIAQFSNCKMPTQAIFIADNGKDKDEKIILIYAKPGEKKIKLHFTHPDRGQVPDAEFNQVMGPQVGAAHGISWKKIAFGGIISLLPHVVLLCVMKHAPLLRSS